MLPKHTPLAARKELSRKLHAAKAAKRLALGVDAETLRWRATHPISPMNDTPRTEAARLDAAEFSDWGTGPTCYCDIEDMRQLERENNALRARVESASAIITELLARTAKTESPECDEAVAAAMAWRHDNK